MSTIIEDSTRYIRFNKKENVKGENEISEDLEAADIKNEEGKDTERNMNENMERKEEAKRRKSKRTSKPSKR